MSYDQIIDTLRQQIQVRAKSMVVTVFGDSIVPRGGEVWLADLIGLMDPFGINDRMVRTAIYRLTQEGYFSATRSGRKSLYALTDEGARIFAAAEKRIYAAAPPLDGDGWTILCLTRALTGTQKKELQKLLGWQGFAEIAPTVLAACPSDAAAVIPILESAGAAGAVAVFEASPASGAGFQGDTAIRSLVTDAWPLDALAAQYETFHALLRPIAAHIDRAGIPTPDQAYRLRGLLVHAYRRLLLRHPSLPPRFCRTAGREHRRCGPMHRSIARYSPRRKPILSGSFPRRTRARPMAY